MDRYPFGYLPKSLEVDDVYYKIDSDFRTALLIMQMYNDKALSPLVKHYTMLEMLFTTLNSHGELVTNIPKNIDEAIAQSMFFLNIGDSDSKDDEAEHQIMDYKADEQLLFPAVNQVFSGREIREESYVHWWTFYGLCQSIDQDSVISNIMGIRSKIAKGKKLEKHEKEFYRENKKMIDTENLTRDRLSKGEEYVRQIKSGNFDFKKSVDR